VSSAPCEFCGYDVPLEWNHCPHCGRPGLFPNVRAAQVESERQALEKRYQATLVDAVARGAEGAVREFDTAAQVSKAVIARPLRDIERLTSSDRELYTTFYALTQAEARLAYGDKWDRLRRVADESLFPGYKEHIRFAALSLDGVGLADFGDYYLVLKEGMIAHRATAFEENSAAFLDYHRYQEPEGSRATWAERSKLCTAKNAKDLRPGMPTSEFPTVLMRQKTATEESRFVEVHIYGSMSVRAVEKVILKKLPKKGPRPYKKSFVLELQDRLKKVGAVLEEER
jgi:hypothetical protein